MKTKEGEYLTYYENGKLESKGYYKNGQLEYKGHYKNGKLEGECLCYYDNGQLESKGNYEDDQLKGEKIEYDENGGLIGTITYTKEQIKDMLGQPGEEWMNNYFDKDGNLNENTELAKARKKWGLSILLEPPKKKKL